MAGSSIELQLEEGREGRKEGCWFFITTYQERIKHAIGIAIADEVLLLEDVLAMIELL